MSARVYFATNRNNEGTDQAPDFGERFHRDGPAFYRVGWAEVEKQSDDPDTGYVVRSTHLASESSQGNPNVLGSQQVFEELKREMMEGRRDVLVYLHGFANEFDGTLCRAAQIADAYRISRAPGDPLFETEPQYRPHVFVFSWPSNGKVFPPWHYFSDRDDAEASGTAMARALLRLLDFLKWAEAAADDERRMKLARTSQAGEAPSPAEDGELMPCRQKLHLIAHSMGNWALRNAVRKLREQHDGNRMRPVFENILLMAADEDDDALEDTDKLACLTELARRVHVYHSSDDRALVVSDTTKFNPDRLGYYGPRTFSGLNTRIQAIDCSGVDTTESAHANHQYYRLRTEVIEDVQAVLTGLVRSDALPWRQIIEPGRRYRIHVGS